MRMDPVGDAHAAQPDRTERMDGKALAKHGRRGLRVGGGSDFLWVEEVRQGYQICHSSARCHLIQ